MGVAKNVECEEEKARLALKILSVFTVNKDILFNDMSPPPKLKYTYKDP